MRARPQWLDAALVALLAVVMLAGCMTRAPQSTTTHEDTGMHTLRYLALGDSYTIGESVAADGRWPLQLVADLHGEGIAIDEPTIIAKTGWTTDELSAAIDAADPASDYDFVTLSIGVNNQYRGRELDNYREEFTTLLQRAIGFAGGDAGHVMVLSIPDWGVSAFGASSGRDVARIARELDAYNATARDICAANGVAFVDVTPVSRERGAEPEMLADDGLHPSALMYRQWVALALPVASRLLAGK